MTHLISLAGLPTCGASIIAEEAPLSQTQIRSKVTCQRCLHP